MGDFELQIFADRLKELRSLLNMTQAEFVKDLGITAAALSAYENNQKNPSISVAKRIAEKYEISIDWLCGLSDKKTVTDKLNTYGDLLRWFRDISIRFPHSISIDKIEKKDGASLVIEDEILVKIFSEWEEVEELCFKKGPSAIKLFFVWISDLIKQYESVELPKKEDYSIFVDNFRD